MIVAGSSRRLSTIRSRSWPFGQPVADPAEVGCQIALERLLGEGAGMAEQAQPDPAIGHEGTAACRIAGRAGERARDRVADDLVGHEAVGCRRQGGAEGQQARQPPQPNTSIAIVSNHASA